MAVVQISHRQLRETRQHISATATQQGSAQPTRIFQTNLLMDGASTSRITRKMGRTEPGSLKAAPGPCWQPEGGGSPARAGTGQQQRRRRTAARRAAAGTKPSYRRAALGSGPGSRRAALAGTPGSRAGSRAGSRRAALVGSPGSRTGSR